LFAQKQEVEKLLYISFLIIGILLSHFSNAQTTKPTPSLHIKKATSKITIDGILNEKDWNTAEKAADFFQQFPADTSYADTRTEAMVTYDDSYLYVAAICYDEIDGEYVIQSLKRDFSYPVSDAFAVFIDPFNDKTNGFSFAVNPLGVQREGLVQEGGGFGVTTAWDNKWYSEVTKQDGKWLVEMAIPFKTIRYKENNTTWRINFSRNDLKRNENSSWAGVPRNFNIATMAFTGELHFDTAPVKAGGNIALIPYAIGNVSHDYETENPTDVRPNAGLDAKVAVTSSLNLDLTINPDFSQVEVDRQVTNLSRFSLFFPERRNFFIENSDLFTNFGFRQIRPFFSRRIGLNSGSVVPILGGARLSGKLTPSLRIGIMNMQTEGVSDLNLPAENYSTVVFQKQLFQKSKSEFLQKFNRSFLAGIFVNRQGFNGSKWNKDDYNRIAGLDFHLASADNVWRGKTFYHHSINAVGNTDNFAHATWLMYNSRKLQAHWNHEYVGKNYFAEVGFVPRISNYNPETESFEQRSYWRFEPNLRLNFYPNSTKINSHGPSLYLSDYLDSAMVTTERKARAGYRIKFINTSEFNAEFSLNQVKLFYDTDVTFSGNTPIIADIYKFNNLNVRYNSDKRKKLNYTLNLDYGEYYIGNKLTYGGSINFRKQPWGIFSINVQQNEITMPEGFQSTYLTLIGPKIELSFTKKLFFTTFIQYNTQIDNVNINTRFQWRFRPMSDLFIVYTDNYNSNIFGIKNRALVVKFVYWLNL
jgi:hypothetical protein